MTGSLVELAHKFDPMETHGVQEDLEGVHHKQNGRDSGHEHKGCDETPRNLEAHG